MKTDRPTIPSNALAPKFGTANDIAPKERMRGWVLAALIIASLQVATGAGADAAPSDHGSMPLPPAAALRQTMRKLWSDHVIWTREYIVAAVAGTPDQAAAASRLMKNQEDIGAAVAAYYGKPTGDKLTALLKEHISIAVDIINDVKAKNSTAQAADEAKWTQNADEIAAFLSGANPESWPLADMQSSMKMHLDLTLQEAVDQLDGAKVFLEDDSWILFRQSGTEPALRVYCEAPSVARVLDMIGEGMKALGESDK